MKPTDRWKQLLDERLHEAVIVLGRIPGVHGFIVGGSVGRGEPWPMSDIDLLPVYTNSTDPVAELDQRRAELVDWWAASGRAQTLDVNWLAFTTTEIRDVMATGSEQAAARMTDRRWFHGLDKAYGGHATNPDDELGNAFAAWMTTIRFHPAVHRPRRPPPSRPQRPVGRPPTQHSTLTWPNSAASSPNSADPHQDEVARGSDGSDI